MSIYIYIYIYTHTYTYIYVRVYMQTLQITNTSGQEMIVFLQQKSRI